MSDDKKYHIKYHVELGEFTKEQADGQGLTDALVLVSILRGPKPHEGEKSIAIISADGYNGGQELISTELFQVWTFLADMLSQEDDLAEWQKKMVAGVIDDVRQKIAGITLHGKMPQ